MEDEAIEEYKSSLDDLTMNSKPLISALTMLAEDYVQFAPRIVQVIESRIKKAPSNQKLPSLYLIDSILKNVHKEEYRKLFAQIIANTFSEVFQKVEEKTRQAMFKLRQTWNELFPSDRLYSLDVRVHGIDPAWPITAAAPSANDNAASIHVNPLFIKQQEKKRTEKEEKEKELLRQKELARQLEIKHKVQQQKRKQEDAIRQQQARERELQMQRQQEIIHQQELTQKAEMQRREETRRRREMEEAELKRRLTEEAEAKMQRELFDKQQELMRLQQQRLQLELAEAKAKLEMQQQQLEMQERSNQIAVVEAKPKSAVSPPTDPRVRKAGKASSAQPSTSQQTAVVHPTKVPSEKKRPERHMARRGGISAREGRPTREMKKRREAEEEEKNRKNTARRNYRSRRASESEEEEEAPPAAVRQRSRSPQVKKRGPSPPLPKKEAIKSSTQKRPSPAKDRPPAKKAKKSDDALPDDLAELFGKEDKDYRRLPPIPKLNTKASPPPNSHVLQSPRSRTTSWDRFKADRPEEYPHPMEFRTPLLSPPPQSQKKALDIPKALHLDRAGDIMAHAESQRKSGKLSDQKYHELLQQVAELYRLQKLESSVQRDQRPPAVDEDFRKKPLLGRPPRERKAQPRIDIPPYDTERYCVPEYDERWSARLQELQGRMPGSHSLVLNNTQYDLKPDSPRCLKVGGMNITACIVSATKEVLLQLHRGSKPECYYVLGEPPRNISMFGREFRIFVLGPLKRFWIDLHQFEVKADSPPLTIWLANQQHNLRICSFTRRIFVDGHDICPFGVPEPQKVQIAYKDHEITFKAPPREIKIDGQLRKLDLGATFPLVMIDNKPHGIRFDGETRCIRVDGRNVEVLFDRPTWHKFSGGRRRLLAFGGPGHEVIIDNQWFEVKFGGAEKSVQIGLNTVIVQLEGPPPDVKILGEIISPNRAREMADWPPVKEYNWHNTIAASNTFTGPQQWDACPPPLPAPPLPGPPPVSFSGPNVPAPQPPPFSQPPLPNFNRPPPPVSLQQPWVPPPAGPMRPPPPDAASSISSQVDVNDLFSKLLTAGIIKKNGGPDKEADKVKEEIKPDIKTVKKIVEIDMTEFNVDKLKKRMPSVVDDLYSGFQCSSCGQRFTPGETEQYREHLDWHFRQNKKEKDVSKVTKYRTWYYSYLDWIQYEEFTSKEDRTHSDVFDKMASSSEPANPSASSGGVPVDRLSCPVASGDDNDDKCDICRDSFEQFWDEEGEEWHLKDAVRVEGRTYHPVCFEDASKSNSKALEDEEDEKPVVAAPVEEAAAMPDPIKDPVAYIQSLTKMAASKKSPPAMVKMEPIVKQESPIKEEVTTPMKKEVTTPVKKEVTTPIKEEATTPTTTSPRPIVIQPLDISPQIPAGIQAASKDPGTPVLDEPARAERKPSIEEPGTPLQDEPSD